MFRQRNVEMIDMHLMRRTVQPFVIRTVEFDPVDIPAGIKRLVSIAAVRCIFRKHTDFIGSGTSVGRLQYLCIDFPGDPKPVYPLISPMDIQLTCSRGKNTVCRIVALCIHHMLGIVINGIPCAVMVCLSGDGYCQQGQT